SAPTRHRPRYHDCHFVTLTWFSLRDHCDTAAKPTSQLPVFSFPIAARSGRCHGVATLTSRRSFVSSSMSAARVGITPTAPNGLRTALAEWDSRCKGPECNRDAL